MKLKSNVLMAGLMTIMVCLTVVYSACKRDKCNNVVCQNGGACDGGNCTCLAGFEGDRCQTLSRDKFVTTWPGGDTCSNDTNQNYSIHLYTEANNPVTMLMTNVLNHYNDSALCTMWGTDTFSFEGSNNGTSYTGSGTLRLDTLKLFYHVQVDTNTYDCEFVSVVNL